VTVGGNVKGGDHRRVGNFSWEGIQGQIHFRRKDDCNVQHLLDRICIRANRHSVFDEARYIPAHSVEASRHKPTESRHIMICGALHKIKSYRTNSSEPSSGSRK
jgi:hypothetical protein